MSYGTAVTLISGGSGSGKTSLIATAAEWVWQKHKKVTRLYTCDGGGFGTKIQALVQAGIIQVWKMRSRAGGGSDGLVEETCLRASTGWWPTVFVDPEKGEAPSGVELYPPTVNVWSIACPNKHVMRTSPVRAGLVAVGNCPTCSINVNQQNAVYSVEESIDPRFSGVGLVAFEGLTSMSDWIMMALADRVGRAELSGEKPALGGIIRSGALAFGSNNRAHYGFAQNQAEKWLLNSMVIPNLVVAPIWTALETRVDEGNGIALPMYGPAIAGQAKTAKVPQWVGNYLGTHQVIDDKGNKGWRLYLSEYRGEDQLPHYYKVRSDPGLLPPYLQDPPGAYFTQFNLGVFFDMLDGATQKSLTETLAKYPDAPGLPSATPAPVASTPSASAPATPSVPKGPAASLPPMPAPPPGRPGAPTMAPSRAPIPAPKAK